MSIKDREKAINAICYIIEQISYPRLNPNQDRATANSILNRLFKDGYLNEKVSVDASEIQDQLEQAVFKCKVEE